MKSEKFKEIVIDLVLWEYSHGVYGADIEKKYSLNRFLENEDELQQFYVLGRIQGQLYVRKADNDYESMVKGDAYDEIISNLIGDIVEKCPPFEPNEETKEAMREARAGKDLIEYESLEDLFKDLHIDDD